MTTAQPKREEVDQKFKWVLEDLIPSDARWEEEYKESMALAGDFAKYRGTLGDGATALYQCLHARDQASEKIGRVYVYAQLKLSEDSTNTVYQAMADKGESLIVAFYAGASFIESEILSIAEDRLKAYMEEEKGLAHYSHYFEDILRQRAHILSPELEEILTKTQEMAQAPENIYGMLNNADMKFGLVEKEGEKIELTHGRYTAFMESSDRDFRKRVFQQFYKPYMDQKNTLATTYGASVKKDIFYARERHYGSALEAALSAHNIPEAVYENLIAAVEKNLPAMHQYIDVRKKALGIDELHMYDIYAPLVAQAETSVNYEEAKATVLEALKPLGAEYTAALADGLGKGWIDVYENQGKKSGAFAWGAYGCHPYVLLNYNNKIDSMFTLAHEMGHAMHSHYTWSNQPYIYGDYTIFVAEVASTVNEALLMEHLLKTTTDETMRKYLINYYMEQFRGTLFRQTMFAEFEMITHRLAEAGEALTSEGLNGLYRELNRKYYGDQVVLDEEIAYEWSRIPHFYTAFYVYQYATGYSAAIALSKGILEKGKAAVADYLNFLKGGSSDYSINLLKKAGVDMASPEPVQKALDVFTGLVAQFEEFVK